MGALYIEPPEPWPTSTSYSLVVGKGYFTHQPQIDKQAFYNAAYGSNWREVATANKVYRRKTLLLELLTCTGLAVVMFGLIVLGIQLVK